MNTLAFLLILSCLAPVPSPATIQLQPEANQDDRIEVSRLEPIPVSSGGLTADEVAAKAVAAAPSIEGKRADVDLAEARVNGVVNSFVPQVTLSASYTRLSDVNVQFGSGALVGAANAGLLGVGMCPDGSGGQCVVDSGGAPVGAAAFDIPQVLDQFSLQARVSVPISDYVLRTYRGLKAAKRSKRAAEVTTDAEARRVAVDARIAYYDWVRTKAQVVATEETIRSANARLEDVKLAFDAGLRTEADVKRIEALVANATSANVQARGFEELSREQLSMLMNEPVEPWAVGEDVMTSDGEPLGPELEAAVAEALRNGSELEALDLNDKAIADGMKTEKAGYYPRPVLHGEATYANPDATFRWSPNGTQRGPWACSSSTRSTGL